MRCLCCADHITQRHVSLTEEVSHPCQRHGALPKKRKEILITIWVKNIKVKIIIFLMISLTWQSAVHHTIVPHTPPYDWLRLHRTNQHCCWVAWLRLQTFMLCKPIGTSVQPVQELLSLPAVPKWGFVIQVQHGFSLKKQDDVTLGPETNHQVLASSLN